MDQDPWHGLIGSPASESLTGYSQGVSQRWILIWSRDQGKIASKHVWLAELSSSGLLD